MNIPVYFPPLPPDPRTFYVNGKFSRAFSEFVVKRALRNCEMRKLEASLRACLVTLKLKNA